MSRLFRIVVVVGLLLPFGVPVAGQATKKGARPGAAPSYRTLTGKLTEVKDGGQVLTLQASEAARTAANGSPTWVLSTGGQTLLLRAGRNGQYSIIEGGELRAGVTVRAVIELEAGGADRMHRTWWLIVFPAGTTPPSR